MGVGHEYPLRFDHHAFSAYCFNTKTCQVTYADTLQVSEDEPSRAPRAGYLNSLGLGGHLGIKNFPAPAQVKWTALDGTELRGTIDVGNVFEDQLILHQVAREQLPDVTVKHSGSPNVVLVVNDRTITVYMRAMVFVKSTGGSPSGFRDDVIQAWQKTY